RTPPKGGVAGRPRHTYTVRPAVAFLQRPTRRTGRSAPIAGPYIRDEGKTQRRHVQDALSEGDEGRGTASSASLSAASGGWSVSNIRASLAPRSVWILRPWAAIRQRASPLPRAVSVSVSAAARWSSLAVR